MIAPLKALITVGVLISATTFCPARAAAEDFWLQIAPPPSPPHVHATPAPRENRVWSPGYYAWSGKNHSWREGHWKEARAGYTWIPSHWEPDGNTWFFRSGHWIPNDLVRG